MKAKTVWLDKQGNEVNLHDAWQEALVNLPIGRALTDEQSQRLSEWLRHEAERSASDTRGMAARMLLEYTETGNPIRSISSLATALKNISLASLNLGDSRADAEFIRDMFNVTMGDDALDVWSVGYKGRKLWRIALTPAGKRTRYKNTLRRS